MRGAVAVSAFLSDIHFTQGQDNLSLYEFNTRSAKHYFCKTCGICTHHQPRSAPDQFGVNVACIEGVSPLDFAELPVMQGRVHPKDSGIAQIAGILRFEKAQ